MSAQETYAPSAVLTRWPIRGLRGTPAVILLATLLSCSESPTPTDPDDPVPFPEPPTIPTVTPVADRYLIDGIIDLASVSAVQTQEVDISSDLGSGIQVRSTMLRWASDNDDRNIYLAFQWSDPTRNNEFTLEGPIDSDGMLLFFDDDGDGVQEMNEDGKAVLTAFNGTQYVDQHTADGDQTDAVGNGFGRISYDAAQQMYSAEFLMPLGDDTDGTDGVKSAATRFNVVILDGAGLALGLGDAGFAYGLIGEGTVTDDWPQLLWSEALGVGHRTLPTDLTGLIVYVSDHDGAFEIYTFDPATGVTTQVTDSPGLFKEGVSLSHDRTRIAFHASPDRQDPSQLEVYTINVDGSGITQLTDNTITDGHPGWSPNDDRIVYASFREGGRASLILMSPDGVEEADLTPPGVDDNDPDWLPDGRIVFKTDRFSAFPETRMAVMNADGTGVIQITSVDGVSDHDATINGTVAIFERFTKDTNFALDVESGFVPWNLIEARVDGSGERTLLVDGWINWLPVASPDGRYIAHLKGSGYTALYLMSSDGTPLGRLLASDSRLTYMDWK